MQTNADYISDFKMFGATLKMGISS